MNPLPEQMTLVFACDAAYAMPLATTLRSIVEANTRHWPLSLLVLDDHIPPETRRKVSDSLPPRSATIRWLTVDTNAFSRYATQPAISKMTYARFLIPDVLPQTVSRILFLDTDILVLDDLEPLWSTNLDGEILGAVVDGLDEIIKSGSAVHVPLPRVQAYFNAGVLLVDLHRWRKARVSERAFDYLNRYPQSPFSDQDAINVACDGCWKPLDPRWNHQGHRTVTISSLTGDRRPGIVHFVTGAKPWTYKSMTSNAAFYDEFRSRTRFARTPLDRGSDAALTAMFRLHLRMSRHPSWRSAWRLVKRLRSGPVEARPVVAWGSRR